MNEEKLKYDVKNYWNKETCGSWSSNKEKFTKEYFEEIEEFRYKIQPEIFAFAEFTRWHGKKVLEVGVGAGTDFLQWARAGAKVFGVDLTEQACEHVRHRLNIYGFQAESIQVADCEKLPFQDNFFDLVWSWGVIHHTPDTEAALKEIVRVLKPGGTAKIMIYHRHSVLAYLFWVKHALLKLKPWLSLSNVLWNKMESPGTKAYTRKEALNMLRKLPVENIQIKTVLTYYDKLERFSRPMQWIARKLAVLLGGDKAGWFMLIHFNKKK